MDVTLGFQIPEDQHELDHALKATDLVLALQTMSNFLRSKLKYGELTQAEEKVYEDVRSTFYEILADHDIDDLI